MLQIFIKWRNPFISTIHTASVLYIILKCFSIILELRMKKRTMRFVINKNIKAIWKISEKYRALIIWRKSHTRKGEVCKCIKACVPKSVFVYFDFVGQRLYKVILCLSLRKSGIGPTPSRVSGLHHREWRAVSYHPGLLGSLESAVATRSDTLEVFFSFHFFDESLGILRTHQSARWNGN